MKHISEIAPSERGYKYFYIQQQKYITFAINGDPEKVVSRVLYRRDNQTYYIQYNKELYYITKEEIYF